MLVQRRRRDTALDQRVTVRPDIVFRDRAYGAVTPPLDERGGVRFPASLAAAAVFIPWRPTENSAIRPERRLSKVAGGDAALTVRDVRLRQSAVGHRAVGSLGSLGVDEERAQPRLRGRPREGSLGGAPSFLPCETYDIGRVLAVGEPIAGFPYRATSSELPLHGRRKDRAPAQRARSQSIVGRDTDKAGSLERRPSQFRAARVWIAGAEHALGAARVNCRALHGRMGPNPRPSVHGEVRSRSVCCRSMGLS